MKKLTVLLFVLLLAAVPALGEGCEGENHGSDHAAACPMKGKKVAESKDVEMTGKVICMHCNLHKEDSCRKVFQSNKDEALINLCPMSDMKAVEAVSDHGEALLVVTGKLVKADDGTLTLEIKTAAKAEKPAA